VVRKVTIGSPGKLTTEQAREAAAKILAKAELGEDPADDRAKQRAEITVAQLCDEYLADGCHLKKASTIATDRGRIKRHIKPLLGRKRLGQVTKADVERFLRDVAGGATAVDEPTETGRSRVTGGKGTATRTVRLLGGIFSYAVDRGYMASNPRLGVKLYPDGKGSASCPQTSYVALVKSCMKLRRWDCLGNSLKELRPSTAQSELRTSARSSPHLLSRLSDFYCSLAVAQERF
jgi:hypothetical protein